ncbi:hypothetical protein [Streptomyces sp. NPDC004284]|uniref:hypothetical protein n=1 Tax=Streptomyces sp. NPDC004284 TaxID=3364695 RepID=UPI0036C1B8C1
MYAGRRCAAVVTGATVLALATPLTASAGSPSVVPAADHVPSGTHTVTLATGDVVTTRHPSGTSGAVVVTGPAAGGPRPTTRRPAAALTQDRTRTTGFWNAVTVTSGWTEFSHESWARIPGSSRAGSGPPSRDQRAKVLDWA